MDKPANAPLVNRDTEPFWTGCEAGRLMAQKCLSCSRLRHPPSPVCNFCLSPDHEWTELSGRGTVWSYAIVRERLEGWEGDIPYVVVIVELEEGIRLVSNLVGTDPERVRIDMEVEALFETGAGKTRLPRFQARAGNARQGANGS